MEDPRGIEMAREAINIFDDLLESIKTKKMYQVHINLKSWNEEMQLHLNIEFSDADIEAILRMRRDGRKPISFTAAYAHTRMRSFLYLEFISIFEYCEIHNFYIDFKPGELEVRLSEIATNAS